MKSQIHEYQKKSKKLMNKILKTIALTILLCYTANAQITKGNWMVGGSGNFSSTVAESKSSNLLTSESKGLGVILSPTFGYFVADKLALGVSPVFGYSKIDGGNSNTSYGAGPFIRYYLLKPEKLINILTHIGYYYGSDSAGSTSNNINFKTGPAIFLNSSVALELTLEYAIGQNKSDFSTSTFKVFNVGLGLQIHLEKE